MRLLLPIALLLAAFAASAQTPLILHVAPGDGGEERTYHDAKIVLPGNRVVTTGLPVVRKHGGPEVIPWREIRYLDIIPSDNMPLAAITFRDGREEMIDVERGWLLPGRGDDPGMDFGIVWRIVVAR